MLCGAALCLQILERGREISKRDWQLLWVAIVELRGAVFIGRWAGGWRCRSAAAQQGYRTLCASVCN